MTSLENTPVWYQCFVAIFLVTCKFLSNLTCNILYRSVMKNIRSKYN